MNEKKKILLQCLFRTHSALAVLINHFSFPEHTFHTLSNTCKEHQHHILYILPQCDGYLATFNVVLAQGQNCVVRVCSEMLFFMQEQKKRSINGDHHGKRLFTIG